MPSGRSCNIAAISKAQGAIVVGIVDEHGNGVISYGKLDNGTDHEVNGDTVFNICSEHAYLPGCCWKT